MKGSARQEYASWRSSVNPKTGAVFTPVRNDTVTGLLVTGFPGNGVFGYGTVGLSR